MMRRIRRVLGVGTRGLDDGFLTGLLVLWLFMKAIYTRDAILEIGIDAIEGINLANMYRYVNLLTRSSYLP